MPAIKALGVALVTQSLHDAMAGSMTPGRGGLSQRAATAPDDQPRLVTVPDAPPAAVDARVLAAPGR